MADGLSTSPNKETVTLRLPSGEMVDALVPAGFSDADLKSYVRMKRPDLFGAPAGVQKPQVNMQTGEGPVAQGMTSFETQLSNLPRNLWQGSFFGEIGNPKVKALHEQRQQQEKQAMSQPGIMPGAKYAGSLINPVVRNESGVDVGATAANLLPYALAAKSAVEETPTSKLTAPVRGAVKGANKVLQNYPKTVGAGVGGAIGQATHLPLARELGAGIGAAVGSEVLPKVRIPGEGFGLPNRVIGGPEKAPQYISPSKVSTTAPESGPVSLNRLTSDIQSLGYSKADALARAKAGIAKYPNDLNAATTEAMRPSRVQAARAPSTPPSSKSSQITQAKGVAAPPKPVYHGTTTADLPAIKQQGLTPLSSRNPYTQGGQADLVKATDSLETAQQYAEMRAQKNGSRPIVLHSTTAAFPEAGSMPGEFISRKPVPAQSLAMQDPSSILPRLQQIAQQPGTGIITREPSGPQTLIEGKPVPANTNLAPALEKSLPQVRIQGKIMQVVRREGTLGMDRLMEAPELQGLSRNQVEAAAMQLGNSKKLWVPTKEADAHGPAGIISLAIRKK